MSPQTFLLPDLGEGLTEAVIVRWLVSVGDTVETDQAVAEVETAKSIVELPTPFAGTVLTLFGAEGEAVQTGAPVLEVGSADDAASTAHEDHEAHASAPATAHAAAAANRVEAEAYRTEERAGAGSGNVLIGYGTGSLGAKGRRRRKGAAVAAATPVAGATAATPAAAATPEASAATGPVAVRSPIVRRLAKELGVDPRTISPTGTDGAVTRHDVLSAAERVTRESAGHAATGAAPTTRATGAEIGALHGLEVLERSRLSPLRQAISTKLSRSRSEIPEATVWVDVDFTELCRLRPAMADEMSKPPSLTTLVARFLLLALRNHPLLAARLNEDATELVTFNGVNLGIAVDTERGLMVPVLPQAEQLNVADLDGALRDLGHQARGGELPAQRLTGSTFTFNNYGGLGVDGSAAIINHPEVAILGMGRVIERPWVVDGEIVARNIAQLSLVFDHRVCDGGYAASFLRDLMGMIEHPVRVLRHV